MKVKLLRMESQKKRRLVISVKALIKPTTEVQLEKQRAVASERRRNDPLYRARARIRSRRWREKQQKADPEKWRAYMRQARAKYHHDHREEIAKRKRDKYWANPEPFRKKSRERAARARRSLENNVHKARQTLPSKTEGRTLMTDSLNAKINSVKKFFLGKTMKVTNAEQDAEVTALIQSLTAARQEFRDAEMKRYQAERAKKQAEKPESPQMKAHKERLAKNVEAGRKAALKARAVFIADSLLRGRRLGNIRYSELHHMKAETAEEYYVIEGLINGGTPADQNDTVRTMYNEAKLKEIVAAAKKKAATNPAPDMRQPPRRGSSRYGHRSETRLNA